MRTPEVDGARLLARLEALAAVGADPAGGVTRLAWGAADREAVALVGSWAAGAGASVRIDPVGTLVAERAGSAAGRHPLAVGSHLDTVVQAGRLDGAYGVLVGVEILSTLAECGVQLRHPLRVAAFANEEGAVAPPFTGSRAAAGIDLGPEMEATGPDGRTLRARLASAGCQPELLGRAGWPPLAGYLEVHVEQGPVLDASGGRTGVVSAITGQVRARVEVTGRANHAGTTPMELRHDALVAAAHGVLAVQRLALDGVVAVATVGRLTVEPGVGNVVPAAATFTVDIRSADDAANAVAMERLERELRQVAASTATEVAVWPTSSSPAVPTAEVWCDILAEACSGRGAAPRAMASGAGHDAQHLGGLGPVGMLFVPSVGGVSHHPDEDTEPGDLVLGAQVALDAILAADVALDG